MGKRKGNDNERLRRVKRRREEGEEMEGRGGRARVGDGRRRA